MGAAFGVARGLFSVAGWVFLGVSTGGFPNRVDLALVGTEAAGLLLSAVGMVGAGLLFARGDRAGVYLMLGAAVGIAAVFAAQPFLVNAAVAAPVRPELDPSPTSFWAASLTPAAALFAASVLASMRLRARAET